MLVAALLLASCAGQSKEKHLARGEEYLKARKYTEAVMEFRTVADIDKNSVEAHWGLARSYENLGRFQETIGELQRVAELKPDNLEAKVKLGNYYLFSEPPQTAETERILADVFARNADFVEAHILKASLLTAQGKPEADVLAALDKAVALDPNRAETYMSRARYFMRLDRAQAAEDAINKGISVAPNRALGYVEYGRFLGYATRQAEAEAQFNRAVEVEPQSVEVREAFAEFYRRSRQFDKAEQSYKELVSMQENSPESRVALADFYVSVDKEDEAVGVFNDVLKDAPEFVRARYRLGEIHLERREYAAVNRQVEALLSLNDYDSEALLLRARVALQENKADDAVKDLEEILKKQPSHKTALFFMASARLALGQIDQARAFVGDLDKYHPKYLRTKLLKIQASFASGEPANALRASGELIESVRNTAPSVDVTALELEDLRARAFTARGLANLELGRLAAARADLQQVRALSPNSAAAMVNLAKVFTAENNPSEAAKLYGDALSKDSTSFDALNGLVGILTAQNQFAEAHGQIDRTIQANGNNKAVAAALHYLKANVFTAEKNASAAENELKASIEADAEYLPAYSAYAALLTERNQIDEAVAQYAAIVERKPSAPVYTLLGMLEEGRGNSAEVEKNYRKALDIAPDAPVAANNLAWFIASGGGGNLDEALQLAQRTVDKNPNVAGYYDTLGWVYYKKQLYAPAVEQLKKAVALDESASKRGAQANPSYRMRLGAALAAAGDRFSARRELETSLQNADGLSRREMQDAKTLLASL